MITDVFGEEHHILTLKFPEGWLPASGQEFDPLSSEFGDYGEENDQFLFPNSTAVDSQNRIYVVNGNSGQISVWSSNYQYLLSFGGGTGDGALSLPRGLYIDDRDRLYVADAVGQNIKVYDVSEEDIIFLFEFGEFGIQDGAFNYPNDVVMDNTGRIYIADRENNRIQVWFY